MVLLGKGIRMVRNHYFCAGLGCQVFPLDQRILCVLICEVISAHGAITSIYS